MTNPIKPGKSVLSDREVALLVEGLDALTREYGRMADDAARLGYRPQAQQMSRVAQEARALASVARSVGITKITVRHS